jgi:hypothetical protein
MTYPTVSGPYGLIPINLIGGQVFASATRSIPITSNSATSIFFGDVVKLNSSGTLDKDVGTSAATPVGVFLGCSYTDPTFGKTFRQFYAANTVASDIVAFVQDDPDALYKVAVVSATTTIGTVTRANVGENAVLVQNAGNTTTGNATAKSIRKFSTPKPPSVRSKKKPSCRASPLLRLRTKVRPSHTTMVRKSSLLATPMKRLPSGSR